MMDALSLIAFALIVLGMFTITFILSWHARPSVKAVFIALFFILYQVVLDIAK